jgi:hypothetical protein
MDAVRHQKRGLERIYMHVYPAHISISYYLHTQRSLMYARHCRRLDNGRCRMDFHQLHNLARALGSHCTWCNSNTHLDECPYYFGGQHMHLFYLFVISSPARINNGPSPLSVVPLSGAPPGRHFTACQTCHSRRDVECDTNCR